MEALDIKGVFKKQLAGQRRFTIVMVCIVIVALAVIFYLGGIGKLDEKTSVYVIISVLFWNFFFHAYQCPKCKKGWFSNEAPRFCPQCAIQLQD